MNAHVKSPLLQNSKGFTLIELLVVISIIGVLAAIGIGINNSGQERARDARRKSDLRQIQGALQLYYQDKGQYPPTYRVSNPAGNWFSELSPTYIKDMPKDPKNVCPVGSCAVWDSTANYTYSYAPWCPVAGRTTAYLLATRLENTTDPAITPPTATTTDCGTYGPLSNGGYVITNP